MNHDKIICKARYEGGMMVCPRCKTFWDLDEKNPDCLSNKEYGNMVLNNLKMDLENQIKAKELK